MIGSLLAGHYRVLKKLGAGGFGQTYIAEDIHRPGNPHCVLKHLKPASSDPQVLEVARKFFNKEAEVLESLGIHSHIPRLLAYFEENEEFYLVQEYIEGHPLSAELASGEIWSEDKVINVLKEVLKILSFVHGQGVIHRDIKPDNIIRNAADNKLYLIDFGAIKEVRNQALTQQGQISVTVAIGTPGYMPTEQGRGTPRPNSDIYALGMIGIQALTGRLPTRLPEEQETGEILWQNLVNINSGLEVVLQKMTRYYFRDRYQSATETLQAFGQLDKTALVTSNSATNSEPVVVNELSLEWVEKGQLCSQTIQEGQSSKNPGTFRLGRNPSKCDLILSDPTVSGLQAEIFFNPSQQNFYLRALRDNNPVTVDGYSFSQGEVPLNENSSLKLGQTQLRVVDITPTPYPAGYVPPEPSMPATILTQNIAPTLPPPGETPQPTATPESEPTWAIASPSSSEEPIVLPKRGKKLSCLAGIAIGVLLACGWGIVQWQGGTPLALSEDPEEPKPSASAEDSIDEIPSSPPTLPKPPSPPPFPKPPSLQSQECFATIVNGNVRREPTSFLDNIITRYSKNTLPVTGKQTPNGWYEVQLGENQFGWAHRDVIRNDEEINSCLEDQRIRIEIIIDLPRPPARDIKFLEQSKRFAEQGNLQSAIIRAEKVPADSKLFNQAQDLIEEWQKNLTEPPLNRNILHQIIPEDTKETMAISEALLTCPDDSDIDLFGETDDFHFAVCVNNGEPRYYLGQEKGTDSNIKVAWNKGFYNGNYLYEPPIHGAINATEDRLQVYLNGELFFNEEVISLYERP